jgi:tetratricopeptide (TPR) repeat protein
VTRERAREHKRGFALVAVVGVIFVGALLLGFLRRPGGTADPFVVATATPVVSDQAKAEAAALLDAAVLLFAEGQPGTALELGDQALGKWPQYDAAQRFVATAVPQATAVEHTVQVRATAAAMAAAQAGLARAQAGADARRVYSSRAGLALQRYADALGLFWEKHRQARERPELLRDAEWRFRTAAALDAMQRAAAELTALGPVPPDLAPAAALFAQLAAETAQLGQDHARGLAGPDAPGLPFPSTRTDRASELLREANVELRRTVPVVPAGP